MDKLPTFKHTIDVPELLKEVIVERITKRKAFLERRSDVLRNFLTVRI